GTGKDVLGPGRMRRLPQIHSGDGRIVMKNTKSAMVANRPGWRVSEQVDRKGNITRILIEPGARRTAGTRRTPCGQRNAPPVQEMTMQQLRDWSHRLHEQADASDDV